MTDYYRRVISLVLRMSSKEIGGGSLPGRALQTRCVVVWDRSADQGAAPLSSRSGRDRHAEYPHCSLAMLSWQCLRQCLATARVLLASLPGI